MQARTERSVVCSAGCYACGPTLSNMGKCAMVPEVCWGLVGAFKWQHSSIISIWHSGTFVVEFRIENAFIMMMFSMLKHLLQTGFF